MADKIVPCLWYDGTAEEAARLYTSLLPDSCIEQIVRAPTDNPSNREGDVMVVEFTLAGRRYVGLNGGPMFHFTEAVSFMVQTDDQAETDRLWNALIADGGAESMCGWLKDRWGMSWQITPRRLLELTTSGEPGVAARVHKAMMTMRKIDIAGIEAAARGETADA